MIGDKFGRAVKVTVKGALGDTKQFGLGGNVRGNAISLVVTVDYALGAVRKFFNYAL